MKRMTKVDGIGQNEIIKCFGCDLERAGAELEHCGYCEHWQAVVDRLAAYEDTGLEPKDFKKAFTEEAVLKLAAQALGTTPDRLRELVKAQAEGRVVVLPCDPCAAYYQWPKTEKYPSVSRFEGVYINEDGEVIYHTQWQDFKAEDIGKTVFLTRAEAEAALGGGGDG